MRDQIRRQGGDGFTELANAERLAKKLGLGFLKDFIETWLARVGADEEDGQVVAALADFSEAIGAVHAEEAIVEDHEAVIGIRTIEEAQAFFGGITGDGAESQGAQKAF